MARRWWVRGMVWTGVVVTTLIGVLLFVLVLVTQSAYGRERVRQIAVRIASRYLLGSLHLGALRFGPGCALALDSASLRDPDDSLLVSLGPTRATCAFGALVQGRLIVTSLDVARPNVVVRQSPSGVWNWSRAIRPDTSTTPPPPSTGPARLIVAGPVHLSGGDVVLEVPWGPPDSLRGAARDRAIDSALTAPLPAIRRSGNALLHRREFSGIAIDAPLIRTEIGDTTVIAQLNAFAVVSSDPVVTVHRIAGRVALLGSRADLDLSTVAFDESKATARGHVDWSAAGMPAIDATVVADTLAFDDLASFVPNLPRSGGGRLQLTMKTAGGTSPTEYQVSSADLRTARSVVRGGVTLELSGSNELTIRDVALDLHPLHTELVNVLVPGVMPPELRGALTARLVARGRGMGGALRVDSLDAQYDDETVPGSVSRVRGRGTVTLGGKAGLSFSRFAVALDAVDARTVVRVAPALAPLSGRLAGTATLDSTFEHLRFSGVDVRYAEGNAAPLRVTGAGGLGLGNVPRFDVTLNAQPFSPAALARSYPALATLPNIEGQVEVHGSANDLTFATTSRSAAGSVTLAGRYSDGASGVAIRASGKVRDVDLRAATGRTDVPAGKLAADVDVDLAGQTVSTLRGTAAVTNIGGTVGGVTVEPSIARVSLTDARVVAESVLVATSAGTVTARGALGLHNDVRDTLAVTASASLADLGPLLRALGVADSVQRDSGGAPGGVADSLGGTVTARARLVGSLDSLDTVGEVRADSVTSPFASVRRAHATWAMAGLRSSPRGQASLEADSLAAGGLNFAAANVAVRSDDGTRWNVSLGTADADVPGGAARGVIATHGDSIGVELDSLVVRIPGTTLGLIRPTRIQRDSAGTIVLDTLQMRGTRGSVITASGTYRTSGPIAVSVDLANAPAFLPGPGGAADSIRVLVDAAVRLEGTAQDPRGTADLRGRVADDDSIPIDSVVVHGTYADSRAHLAVDAHGRTRSLVSGRVDGPVELSLSPFKATLLDEPMTGQLSIDSLYLPDISRLTPGARLTGGVLRTRVTLSGTALHPRAVGNASLADGAARIDALGIQVHDANAALDLASDRITISKTSVRAGKDPEGRAELEGTVGLADSGRVELHLRTASMPVMRLPTTADLDVTSDLQLVGPYARPTLSGRITVDRGVLRLPDMGRAGVVGVDDTAFVRLVDSLAPARIERASAPLERFAIGDVQVAMGPNVWIRSAEASVQLGGSIGLEPAAPGPGVAEGQVALRGRLVTQRGTYRLNIGAFTRAFELEQGSVQFTGEPELNPKLDINAVYTRERAEDSQSSAGGALKVRAHLGGTLERPVLTLSSTDSKLTQAELMSYLVTGQASSELGNAVDQSVITNELVASATGALAQRLAGGMFDVVNVTAGSTNDHGDNRSTAADAFSSSRLGVGKQLSNRVFLKVDAGLCALTGGAASTDLSQTLGVSLDYRFRRGVHGAVSSAPSTNGATCANQASGRGTALTPRQWGVDLSRVWRF